MCIAIYKPAGETIGTDRLQHCWLQHPHGGGFAMPDGDGGVAVTKAMTWAEFADRWQQLASPALPMLIHFRWATHGVINLSNCHPHRVDEDLVVVHKGVIRPMTRHAASGRSDTAVFVDRVLRQIPATAITSPGVAELLDQYIGHSRLAFMTGSGAVTLIGENRGEWNDGCWYSDSSYRTVARRRTRRPLPTASSYPHGRWESVREATKTEAHRLLNVNGPDLELWSDEDLSVLADAYPPDVDEAWPTDDREAVAV